MWFQRIQSAVLLPFIVSLAACVPVRPADKILLSDQALSFIEIGKTTKEEIAGELTHRAMKIVDGKVSANLRRYEYRDGDWWLYAQAKRNRDWLIFMPHGGEWYGGTDYHFLLIKFDKQSVVTEYDLLEPKDGRCNQEGICLLADMYTLLATIEEDRAAKRFGVPAERCGIYIYGETRLSGTSVSVDDQFVGPLVNNKHFYFLDLEPGIHKVAGARPSWVFQDSASAEFECVSGSAYFFSLGERPTYVPDKRQLFQIERQVEDTGRKAVAERQLTLISSLGSGRTIAIRTQQQTLNHLRTVELFEGLEKRGDVYFEIDSVEPYTGTRTTSFQNGRPAASIDFKNGLLDGVYSIWDEDGTKRRETRYEGGAVVDDQVWCPDGTEAQHPSLRCK